MKVRPKYISSTYYSYNALIIQLQLDLYPCDILNAIVTNPTTPTSYQYEL